MKNVTMLRLNIREVLTNYCMDNAYDSEDHSEGCDRCEEMEDALIEAVETWKVRAYGVGKGKA